MSDARLASHRRLRTIDAHTGGEPLRIIIDGWPDIPGDTMLRKRSHARTHHDELRRALMLEPRGHADMYGAIPTEPVTEDGDLGVLFLHNEGFSTMCGHGIIALTKVLLDLDRVPRSDPEQPVLRIDTPAGRVTARATLAADGSVSRVQFLNVPSFVLATDACVDVPGRGVLRYDLAFGGAFYAYVDAEPLGMSLDAEHAATLIEAGRAIKRHVAETAEIAHPDPDVDPDLEFLYGTIFVGPAASDGAHSRNVCVFADGEVDRSPTGTGVSGRAALHHHRGDLPATEWITIESILGSRFDVRVAETVDLHGRPAIVPEVRGEAHITGRHEFLLDPHDPLRHGFFLR